MKPSEIFKSISAFISKPFSKNKFATITEESIRAQIEDTLWALNISSSAIKLLSEKQFNTMYTQALEILKMNVDVNRTVGKPASIFIQSIDKNLKGKARSAGLYRVLLTTSDSIEKMLTDFQENLSTIFVDQEGIVLKDLQISHTLFFGAIEAAQIYSSMNSYLIAVLSHVLSIAKNGENTLPRYMCDYLVDHADTYLQIINVMSHDSDHTLTVIADLRKSGSDFKLVVDGTTHGLTGGSVSLWQAAFKVLNQHAVTYAKNPYLWAATFAIGAALAYPTLSESYIDRRHIHYELLKERKKWLECHVANIKLDLEGTDANSPDSIKNQKIVAFYDDEIATLDKKINSYYAD